MKKVLVLLVSILIIAAGQPLTSVSARQSEPVAENADSWRNWTIPLNVSQSAANEAVWPALDTVDGQNIYLAWSDGRDEPMNIYYATSADSGWQWSTAQQAWGTSLKSQRPTLVVTGTTPFIAWSDEYQVGDDAHHTTYQTTLGAGSAITVPNERTALAAVSRLATGADGALHIALQGSEPDSLTEILYSHRSSDATRWPTATVVVTQSIGLALNPDIGVSADGQTIHLVWQDFSGIRYQRGQRSGQSTNWQSPQTLSQDDNLSVRPAIVVRTDAIHVAWAEQVGSGPEKFNTQYVLYSRSEDGGDSWSEPARIDAEPVSANDSFPTDVAPALAVTPSGAICIAWHGYRSAASPYEDIYVSCSTDQGTSWARPVNVSRSSGADIISIRPTLASGSDGILHLAWQELVNKNANPEDEYQIYYSRSLPYTVLMPIVWR